MKEEKKVKKTIEFNLSGLTLDDLVEFEEGDQTSFRFIRGFLGQFVANGQGGALPKDQGIKKVGAVPVVNLSEMTEQFTKEVSTVTETAVNPTTETSSEEPSEDQDEAPSG